MRPVEFVGIIVGLAMAWIAVIGAVVWIIRTL